MENSVSIYSFAFRCEWGEIGWMACLSIHSPWCSLMTQTGILLKMHDADDQHTTLAPTHSTWCFWKFWNMNKRRFEYPQVEGWACVFAVHDVWSVGTREPHEYPRASYAMFHRKINKLINNGKTNKCARTRYTNSATPYHATRSIVFTSPFWLTAPGVVSYALFALNTLLPFAVRHSPFLGISTVCVRWRSTALFSIYSLNFISQSLTWKKWEK